MAVAQLAERRDVAPEVAGSSPVGHPLASGDADTGVSGPGIGCSTRASSSTAEQRTLNPQVSGSNPEGRTQHGSSDFSGESLVSGVAQN